MAGYRTGSKWNDLNELRCLLALKQLQEKNYPRGLLTKLAIDIAKISGLGVGSVKAKIGNYKSVAGVTAHSNASSNTKSIYDKYGLLSISKLQERLLVADS
ncbi:MAG: hypothetical protein ACJA1I_000820 [Zhongshania marina]|jgi:hypothetical protein